MISWAFIFEAPEIQRFAQKAVPRARQVLGTMPLR